MNWDFLRTNWVHDRFEQWADTDARIAQIKAETDAHISRINAESDNRRFEASQDRVRGIGRHGHNDIKGHTADSCTHYADNDGNDGVASWP